MLVKIVWGMGFVNCFVLRIIINKINVWIILAIGVLLLELILIIVCIVVLVFGKLLYRFEIRLLMFCFINLRLEL